MNNEKFDFFGNKIVFTDIKMISVKLVVEKAMFGLLKKEYLVPSLVLKSLNKPLLGDPLSAEEASSWMYHAKNYIELSLDCVALEHKNDEGMHSFVFV